MVSRLNEEQATDGDFAKKTRSSSSRVMGFTDSFPGFKKSQWRPAEMSHFFAYPYWLVILGCTTRFVGDYHNISQPIIGVRIKHAEQWERAFLWLKTGLMLFAMNEGVRGTYYHRRKFRSQTSDNMERWKAEQGRGREKRKIRRERVRRQKIQMREKVGKSRNTVFFQWFVAPEGRKVGSLKRRVRSQLATGAMKNCTPLWREAHFQVKMYKTPQRRTTFGSCDVEKMHAVVARSTFRSQKC